MMFNYRLHLLKSTWIEHLVVLGIGKDNTVKDCVLCAWRSQCMQRVM